MSPNRRHFLQSLAAGAVVAGAPRWAFARTFNPAHEQAPAVRDPKYREWSTTALGEAKDGLFPIENGEIAGPVQNFRWNDGPARAFDNVSTLGRAVPMHVGAAYDNPGTALVPAMKIEDFRMTSISPAV